MTADGEESSALLLHDPRTREKAIAQLRRDNPGVWLKVIAMLIPREHRVERSNALKNLTDAQLEAMVEYLKTSLEAQAGGPVKVIEGMIEPTTGAGYRSPGARAS